MKIWCKGRNLKKEKKKKIVGESNENKNAGWI